jgi:hypothetical protein
VAGSRVVHDRFTLSRDALRHLRLLSRQSGSRVREGRRACLRERVPGSYKAPSVALASRHSQRLRVSRVAARPGATGPTRTCERGRAGEIANAIARSSNFRSGSSIGIAPGSPLRGSHRSQGLPVGSVQLRSAALGPSEPEAEPGARRLEPRTRSWEHPEPEPGSPDGPQGPGSILRWSFRERARSRRLTAAA